MPAYNFQYFIDGKEIYHETIYSRSLRGAKVSASSQAQSPDIEISISDVAMQKKATRINGKWIDENVTV